MYEKIAEITKKFEAQIFAANDFYHKAIRRAHNEYHDALSQVIAPGNETGKLTTKEEEVDVVDLIFREHAPSASRTID